MPTTRRRCVRGPRGFSIFLKTHLLLGSAYIDGEGYGERDEFDEEAARADWTRYGSDLMAEFFATFSRPACKSLRPWAWWKFSCPEARPSGGAVAEFELLQRHGLLLPGDETRCDLLAREQEFRREQEERYIRQKERGPYGND